MFFFSLEDKLKLKMKTPRFEKMLNQPRPSMVGKMGKTLVFQSITKRNLPKTAENNPFALGTDMILILN